jgi:glutamyl-tRNA reductase
MNADSPEWPSTVDAERDDVDPVAVRRAILARGEAVKRRELQEAVDRLESLGSLTDEQRRIVAEMATAIVDDVLAAPESALDDSAEDDLDTVLTAIELFGPDR